jgi:hypothetical protein
MSVDTKTQLPHHAVQQGEETFRVSNVLLLRSCRSTCMHGCACTRICTTSLMTAAQQCATPYVYMPTIAAADTSAAGYKLFPTTNFCQPRTRHGRSLLWRHALRSTNMLQMPAALNSGAAKLYMISCCCSNQGAPCAAWRKSQAYGGCWT